MYEEHIDDNGAGSVSSDDDVNCVELTVPEHIAAYIVKGEVSRNIEQLTCDNSLLEKVTANYVIAKKILSNLTWQDKCLCKHVCSMWHSAVNTLQKEQIWPTDFSINMRFNCIKNGIKLLKSSNFYTEPLAVFAFVNRAAFMSSVRCESLVSSPCDPACEKEHYLIDVIKRDVVVPKNCMITVKGCFLSYLPLPQSVTYENAIRNRMFLRSDAFAGGIFIPVIPNVQFTVINIQDMRHVKDRFFPIVDKLAETQYIKGALVFASDNYLLHSVEDIIFLNHFKTVQPNVPYALGGCIVEDLMTNHTDVTEIIERINEGRDYISENLVSIGLFSVPRNAEPADISNFDMYSLILESSDWTKAKIQSSIDEFAKSVPQFQHSVAIRLSCVGRDQKHELEQQYFRNAFPTTVLLGCYGNGELGINHPARPEIEESYKAIKRHRRDPGPQFGLMYSYSTIFVYIGWGKIVSQPKPI